MSEGTEIIETHLVDGQILPLAPFPQSLVVRRGYQRCENITVPQLENFFANVEKIGTLYRSAALAGLSYQTINRLRKDDETFKEMLEEAMTVYRESLEHEAHRRAVEGWEEPVFSQKTGQEMGTIRKYDGKLLELLLKRHIPDFRERFEGEIKVTGGVLIAPVAPATPEDWAAQHGAKQIELLVSRDKGDEEDGGPAPE